jgi:hypothetical protein
MPCAAFYHLRFIPMSNFFPMPSGDRWFLLTIIIFSVIAFLPWLQEIQASGMALLGWMMAALMILSPAIALIRLIRQNRALKK